MEKFKIELELTDDELVALGYCMGAGMEAARRSSVVDMFDIVRELNEKIRKQIDAGDVAEEMLQ